MLSVLIRSLELQDDWIFTYCFMALASIVSTTWICHFKAIFSSCNNSRVTKLPLLIQRKQTIFQTSVQHKKSTYFIEA